MRGVKKMKEYLKFIGKTSIYHCNDLLIPVKITDVKQVYGNIHFEIEPVSGKGSVWVRDNSLCSFSN